VKNKSPITEFFRMLPSRKVIRRNVARENGRDW